MVCRRWILGVFILASVILSCTDLDEDKGTGEEEGYQLLITRNGVPEAILKESVLRFFTMVAFGSEFGHDFDIITQWKKPMKIFVGGNRDSTLIEETHLIVEELNQLFLDGFHITMTDDSLDSNFYIFLGSPGEYSRLFPSVASYVDENNGLVMTQWNENFELESGHMYVSDLVNSLELKRHILREELTQALGLAKDIPHHSDSIFFEGFSWVTEYSDYDIEAIRLLYHPQIRSGLSKDLAVDMVKEIIGIH